MNPAIIRAAAKSTIPQAVAELNRSETGRAVREQLQTFLNGRVSNLDQSGWAALHVLVCAYECGLAGTVLEELAR